MHLGQICNIRSSNGIHNSVNFYILLPKILKKLADFFYREMYKNQ